MKQYTTEGVENKQSIARIERGDEQDVNPAYSSNDYEEFCQYQKDKGLRRDLWDTLPQMWDRELRFRDEFEQALIKFSESKN